MVRCACGSRSTRQTFFPASASAAPRLTVVVVLPTPPFWFINAMVRMRDLRVRPQILADLWGNTRRDTGHLSLVTRGNTAEPTRYNDGPLNRGQGTMKIRNLPL